MENTRKFQVEKRGKRSWILIRQAPHDPQYKLGSHIPGYGKVVAIDGDDDPGKGRGIHRAYRFVDGFFVEGK